MYKYVIIAQLALALWTKLAYRRTCDYNEKMIKDEKLLTKLNKEQVNICHLGGTEAPFSGKYDKNDDPGMYNCAVCGTPLFSSETKFDSGTGWPSFWDYAIKGNIESKEDYSLGMKRTEVLCKKCGSHLGHVFDDGPKKTKDGKPATGLRYCINSVALDFKPDHKK